METTHTKTKRKPVHNTGLAKVAVQCSEVTFVVNQTSVFQIKFCGKNPALLLTTNPYLKV